MTTWFGSLYRSSLGKKAVMAVTGIVLWGFVLGHMLGNLKLIFGETSFNEYAEWLRVVGVPALPHSGILWGVRIVLLACLALHVHAAWSLTVMNRRARPLDYASRRPQQTGWAERSMRWSGVAILAFVVYHLLHFTTGDAHGDFLPGEVYHNVVVAFSNGWIALLYVAAMALLGMHLYHGLWSMFQSLGWNHPRFNPWRRAFAVAFALIVSLGFIVVPVVVFAGLVGGGR